MNHIEPMSSPSLRERLASLPMTVKSKALTRARCPNCKKEGGIYVMETIRSPEGRHRWRGCRLCGHHFETDMALASNCQHCGIPGNYRGVSTRNIRNGVFRFYRCRSCNGYTSAFENFPIPEDKVKRPRLDY
jgi:hypothetical protein